MISGIDPDDGRYDDFTFVLLDSSKTYECHLVTTEGSYANSPAGNGGVIIKPQDNGMNKSLVFTQ